jgi:hypothetical protein
MIGRLGLAGGYKIRFFIALPIEIVMLHVRHPMYASIIASHGCPNINECPSSLLLRLITRKSARYSQESTKISMSFNVLIGLTNDLLANSNIV